MSDVDFPYDITRNFYFGECIGTNDPLMLGRVRLRPLDENFEQRKTSAIGFDPLGSCNTNGPWSSKDPFVFLPFLPYFINQVPKVGEHAMIFYFSRNKRSGKNKFYMIAPYSSPMTIKYEDYRSAQTQLDSGNQNSRTSLPDILDCGSQYLDQEGKGVFAEPIDITISSRDTSDIILKDRDLLLRSGKHLTFERGERPLPNNNRAFIQMSYFDKIKNYLEPTQYTKLETNSEAIKYLVEYQCSTINTQADAFTGMVMIYKLKDIPSVQTNFFDWETELSATTQELVYTKNLTNLPLSEFAGQIVSVLRDFQFRPSSLFNDSNFWINSSQFPFFYRPDKSIRSTLSNFIDDFDVNSLENMAKLTDKVRIAASSINAGYGLVNDKENGIRLPFRGINEISVPVETKVLDNTCTLIGSETIYLLSHLQTIPGKDKVNLNDSLYGISASTVFEQIQPNTSSMVRGEELLELLGLVVNFLITHSHPYPMLPPTPISKTGISTADILTKMQEAYEKVLNKNIRIN
jgi:hypothetical protein